MSYGHHFQLIKSPIVSEKSSGLGDKSQFVFKVDLKANKTEIKKAVENFFQVKVKAVNTLVVKGKAKRFKNKLGKRKDFKKAYVVLEPGHDINFSE